MLNVVVINGGRGAASLIPPLLGTQGLNVTSVVNAYDDGKSTGEIRRFFGMLGPSDIRKVQELMLPESDPDFAANQHVFRYRYPLGCDRSVVLATLKAFSDGTSNDLAGASFTNRKVALHLRAFVRHFVEGLDVNEKAIGERMDFADCSLMNILYAGAFAACGRNFEEAARCIDRLFKLKGTVLPTSIEDKRLVALRENGEMLYSEAEIVELRSNVRINRIYLLDGGLNRDRFESLSAEEKLYYLNRHHCYVAVSPGVKLALQQADIIIYSAGTQHSSLYPTYLSVGFAESIADNRSALKVFVTNIGADYETPSYKASDYIKGAFRYLTLTGERRYSMADFFDAVLINKSRLKAGETYVEYDEEAYADVPVRRIVDHFESATLPGRHDGRRLVETILGLYDEVNTPQ